MKPYRRAASSVGLLALAGLARGRLDRLDSASALGRISAHLPLTAAFLVFGLGLYLTVQAIAGNATF